MSCWLTVCMGRWWKPICARQARSPATCCTSGSICCTSFVSGSTRRWRPSAATSRWSSPWSWLRFRFWSSSSRSRIARASSAFGYSLGEIAALVCGGVYRLPDVLPPLLSMAKEAAELARDVTMGVLFSRGPELNIEAVERLCTQINMEGRGVVAISSLLSPNTVLLLGQEDTIDRFAARMGDVLPDKTYLRKNKDRWPPLHTPILWQQLIPNRGRPPDARPFAGGMQRPQPPVISLVTGKASYNDFNSRKLINQWIDHPQRLWDAIYETLVAGVETIIHVGPAPNLLPATYKRISDNVTVQLSGRTLNSLGLRAVSSVWRPWLSKVLSSRTALLQAPFIEHIVLEDWLLAQSVDTPRVADVEVTG